MKDIDLKPLHSKNKIIVYSRYVLSKLSWHLTIADLSKTWISENLDPIVNQHVRKLLEIPTTTPTCNMINITQQRKLLHHFVKIKKTNLTTNFCIKDHSSQVFPNFRYLKSIRSGQLANLNYRGTFSTSQFDILIIKFLVRLHGEYNILIKLCGNTT